MMLHVDSITFILKIVSTVCAEELYTPDYIVLLFFDWQSLSILRENFFPPQNKLSVVGMDRYELPKVVFSLLN